MRGNLRSLPDFEVPVLLGAALEEDVPIVVLHLARPPITIPGREALGIASHFEAARGAHLVRDREKGKPHGGTLIVPWDIRWRTVGTVDEVLDDAHLSPKWLLAGIKRFASERPARLGRLKRAVHEGLD